MCHGHTHVPLGGRSCLARLLLRALMHAAAEHLRKTGERALRSGLRAWPMIIAAAFEAGVSYGCVRGTEFLEAGTGLAEAGVPSGAP